MAALRPVLNNKRYIASIVVVCLSTFSYGLRRSLGSPSDAIVQPIADECGANDPKKFDFGQCPDLFSCVLDKLPSATAAGFSSGTSIAALIPTIMGLLGTAPQDLVQLAMFSPLRAIVTCFFGIGIPSSLFYQLVPVLPSRVNVQSKSSELTKEWTRLVPDFGGHGFTKILLRIAVDITILGLGAIMLWRNIWVGWTTIVTWRCEYSFLLIVWPIACFVWLIISMSLLCILSKKIEFFFTTESGVSEQKSFWNLIVLPYQRMTHQCGPAKSELPTDTSHGTATLDETANLEMTGNNKDQAGQVIQAPLQTGTYTHCTVRITMASSRGIRSWHVFEAAIETLSAGLYLYATFVLASTTFLSGSDAIIYATVMALCMLAIRLLIILF